MSKRAPSPLEGSRQKAKVEAWHHRLKRYSGAMRPLPLLLAYLLAVFAGGALLAPWLHCLAQAAAQVWPGLNSLAQSPFHRFLNRSLLLLALAGLWPLMRGLGARSWADLGFCGGAAARHWGKGFLLGFGSLALVALLALGSGARDINWERDGAQVARHLFNATIAALLVSVLEEILFRGAVFGGLRRHYGAPLALAVSSLVYALVHFLAPARHAGPVRWDSGLALLPAMLAGFGDWRALTPAFFNLMLAGFLLALVYQRAGSLFAAIGLHAGWIFWLKTFGFFTVAATPAASWLWGAGKLIDGWGTLLALALVWPAARWLWVPATPKETGKGDGTTPGAP